MTRNLTNYTFATRRHPRRPWWRAPGRLDGRSVLTWLLALTVCGAVWASLIYLIGEAV